MDARALLLAGRRASAGVRACLFGPRLSADRDRGGVLDRERGSAALQGFQAGRAGRTGRPSSRLAQGLPLLHRGRGLQLLLKRTPLLTKPNNEMSALRFR